MQKLQLRIAQTCRFLLSWLLLRNDHWLEGCSGTHGNVFLGKDWSLCMNDTQGDSYYFQFRCPQKLFENSLSQGRHAQYV